MFYNPRPLFEKLLFLIWFVSTNFIYERISRNLIQRSNIVISDMSGYRYTHFLLYRVTVLCLFHCICISNSKDLLVLKSWCPLLDDHKKWCRSFFFKINRRQNKHFRRIGPQSQATYMHVVYTDYTWIKFKMT